MLALAAEKIKRDCPGANSDYHVYIQQNTITRIRPCGGLRREMVPQTSQWH
jgi:hypothetical protein